MKEERRKKKKKKKKEEKMKPTAGPLIAERKRSRCTTSTFRRRFERRCFPCVLVKTGKLLNTELYINKFIIELDNFELLAYTCIKYAQKENMQTTAYKESRLKHSYRGMHSLHFNQEVTEVTK